MRPASKIVDDQYLEMRWRCLSLAADLDRIQRASGGGQVMDSDPRIKDLRAALGELLSPDVGRAQRVQWLLSDHTTAITGDPK